MGRRYAHDEEYTQLMQTSRWRKLRTWQLHRQPMCERCSEAGIVTRATEVHHTQPIERGGDLEEKARRCFTASNLQSLCRDCHIAVHAELMSHAPESIAATAQAEAEAMKSRLFGGADD